MSAEMSACRARSAAMRASVHAERRSRAVADAGYWVDSGSASRAAAVVIEDGARVR